MKRILLTMIKNTKKLICLLVVIALFGVSATLIGCNRRSDEQKIKILCTVFPVYDWAKSIIGDSDAVSLSLLVENGTDLHSFQPSFGDMAKIKDSDAVIYIGGDSDEWVADSVNEDAISVELSAINGIALYELSADSVAHAHTHEDGEECHEAHEHSHGFDEHLWLSLRNAKTACLALCELLSELDPENASAYEENTASYIEKLDELDARMSALAKNVNEPLLFADRFPFVYLLSDYNVDYYAAFEGCTTDTGADFDTVITLSKKLDALEKKYVFTTESPTDGLADSVIEQSKSKQATVIALDSLQSTVKSDASGGKSYLSVMNENVSALEKIFN